MLLAETSDSVMIGMLISRQIAKRHIVVGGLLNASRARLANRVAVQQQPRQHLRMIGRQAAPVLAIIAIIDLAQIEVMDHIRNKAREMIFRQPIL